MVGCLITKLLKSKTLATLGVFAGANLASAVVSGVGGVLQARWVDPELLGGFQKYGILTGYLALLVVVVQDGLARQFPYLIGKGKQEEAIAIASVAKAWYLGVAAVVFLILLTLSGVALLRSDYFAVAGWGAQAVLALSSTYGVYLQTIYRRSMEFKRLSYNGLIGSSVGFLLLGVVKWLGYYGLAIRSVCSCLLRIVLDAKYIPLRIVATWNSRVFCDLARISIPLSIEGYLRTSFMSATFGFLVVKYCGARDLGLYGIAAAFEGFACVFVSSLMQIFDVKMANQFGATESLRKGVKMLIKPTVFGIGMALICAVILCALIGPFIRLFVPRYIDAIPIVYLLSLGLPIGAAILPTRLLRVALMYKSIYAIALSRVITLIVVVQFVPHTIEWFAGCKIIAEFASVLCGWGLLCYNMEK